jgi:hypothetical protein
MQVINLTYQDQLELDPTEKPTSDFAIAQERAFVGEYYGPISVYNLRNKRKVSKIHFDHRRDEIATDGEFLYIMERGPFDLDEKDILLATERAIQAEYPETQFVGKPLRDVDDVPWLALDSDCKRQLQRVVAFPVKDFRYGGYVWGVDFATKMHTRVVTIGHMPKLHVASLDGCVEVGYASSESDLSSGASIYLRNGQQFAPEKNSASTPKPYVRVRKMDRMLEAFDATAQYEDKQRCDQLKIVYTGRKPHDVLATFSVGELVHVLCDHRATHEDGRVSVHEQPHIMTYRMSLCDLTPVQK